MPYSSQSKPKNLSTLPHNAPRAALQHHGSGKERRRDHVPSVIRPPLLSSSFPRGGDSGGPPQDVPLASDNVPLIFKTDAHILKPFNGGNDADTSDVLRFGRRGSRLKSFSPAVNAQLLGTDIVKPSLSPADRVSSPALSEPLETSLEGGIRDQASIRAADGTSHLLEKIDRSTKFKPEGDAQLMSLVYDRFKDLEASERALAAKHDEAARLQQEVAQLQRRLDDDEREKSALARDLEKAREDARKITAKAKCLAALGSELAEFKKHSIMAFKTVDDLVESFADMRLTAQQSVQEIQKFMDESNEQTCSVKTKRVIQDTRMALSKAQEVTDIYRDRLQSVGGDLIETRDRVTQLEASRLEELRVLQTHVTEVQELRASMGVLQTELREAVVKSERCEIDLNLKDKELECLQMKIKTDLAALETNKSQLEGALESRDEYISQLEVQGVLCRSQDEIRALKDEITSKENERQRLDHDHRDLEIKFHMLQVETQEKDKRLVVLVSLETDLRLTHETLHEKDKKLHEAAITNNNLQERLDMLSTDVSGWEKRVEHLQEDLKRCDADRQTAQLEYQQAVVYEKMFEDAKTNMRRLEEQLRGAESLLKARIASPNCMIF
ncbi:hypothetical protein PUNSTDRAFT_132542 [Punctularia strigosozonata HHB-11173 SS5]|uniref:uncharacterized protein n=1 Tax=Punctularia strigosozonata (strain HHB-11173) TaxID=741275 RepID=UPI0004416846|nr:uncharacterized protein PUNSTDRAFT_132542 [Punctularia strigosozonata HHB-11173 SS5]EIN10449.1 hypothetical protein PUNSTDRAFT_132542 [Punctularia strigosozonata HHB-11173 SS5]